MKVLHSFLSLHPDPSDITLVKPSDWNAEHEIVGDLNLEGYNLYGSNQSGGNLNLYSTLHPTKGKIYLGANSAYDEVNDRFGIGINIPTEKFQVRLDGIGSEQITGFLLENSTLAAVGVPQSSPAIRLRGQGWKTTGPAGSQPAEWFIQAVPVQGTDSPGCSLYFRQRINDGSYILPLYFDYTSTIADFVIVHPTGPTLSLVRGSGPNDYDCHFYNDGSAFRMRAGKSLPLGFSVIGSDMSEIASLKIRGGNTGYIGIGRNTGAWDPISTLCVYDGGVAGLFGITTLTIQAAGAWQAANPLLKLVDSGGSTILAAITSAGYLQIGANQVVGARVIDARCDDAINSGDATTDGVIDALRDAMIAHGLIAAA